MRTHFLKTWPEYFREVESGQKRFEVRNNDRHFQSGDKVVLQWYDPHTNEYNGEELIFIIGYVLNLSRYVPSDEYVVFSLVELSHNHVQALKAKVEKIPHLLEVLKFYSTGWVKKHARKNEYGLSEEVHKNPAVFSDAGKRADQAIAEYERES